MHFMLKLAPVWLYRLVEPLVCRRFHANYVERSVHDVLTELIGDRRLVAILEGQFGDIGESPRDLPAFMAAGVFSHYYRGGYYPRGGSQAVVRALIPTIEAAGGRVLVKADVDEIVVCERTGRALGVRMAKSGDVLTAPQICSAAGLRNTFGRLLSEATVKRYALPRAHVEERIGASAAHICTFIGFDASAEELELCSSNVWCLPADAPDYDLSAKVDEYRRDPLNTDMLCFISFPSAKDPEWPADERNRNRSTCTLITEGFDSWFERERFGSLKSGKRGPEYEAIKKQYERRLTETLFKHFPKCRDHVVYMSTSTPLTSSYYLQAPSGESYGAGSKKERFSTEAGVISRPQCAQIPNLYLAGQDVVTAGIVGALTGGMLAAHAMLGYGTIIDMLTGRNLINDIRSVK
jgi:all-trans-retinol 13,14-reductase